MFVIYAFEQKGDPYSFCLSAPIANQPTRHYTIMETLLKSCCLPNNSYSSTLRMQELLLEV